MTAAACCGAGDGMPDTDFPALDLNKKMKKFGIDEVCICEVDEFSSNSKYVSSLDVYIDRT